jgi:hypothetical protein
MIYIKKIRAAILVLKNFSYSMAMLASIIRKQYHVIVYKSGVNYVLDKSTEMHTKIIEEEKT